MTFDEALRLVNGSEPVATRLRFLPPEHNWVVGRFGLDLRSVFGVDARARYRANLAERKRLRDRSSSAAGGDLDSTKREELEEKEEVLAAVPYFDLSTLSGGALSTLLDRVKLVNCGPGIPILVPSDCLDDAVACARDILGTA